MSRNRRGGGAILFALALLSTMNDKPKQADLQLRHRAAVFSAYESPQFSSADRQLIDRHCRLGLPQRTAAGLGHSRTIIREGYVLEHSSELLIPFWVCERLSKDDLQGNFTGRLKPEPFAPDPALEQWPHSLKADYLNSKFDKGHMSPDANRTTKKLKEETYYMSNMVPQVGVGFNQHVWKYFECAVREWAESRNELWITTGAFLHEPDEESSATANGLVSYFAIGNRLVTVPTHLYKIVLARGTNGKWEALALVMENRRYDSDEPFQPHLKSIDWIEERTGFDFFPDLDDPDEDDLEKDPAPAVWTITRPNCGK